MFQLSLCLTVLLRAVAGGVGSVSEASDLAGLIGHEIEFIKPHQPPPQNFLKKLIRKPSEMLRSYPEQWLRIYPADNILMGNLEVRLSEDAYKIHVEGIIPAAYDENSFIADLGEANIEIPTDLHEWPYGTARLLRTTHPVEMNVISRKSRTRHWDKIVAVQQSLTFKVTRLQGEKLENGHYGNDIMLIEAIQYPTFERGALSGLTIDEKPVIYGNIPTWKVPTAFVDIICEIRGTERFINDHVLGNPRPDYSLPYLFVFPKSMPIFLMDEDITALEFGTPGTVRTKLKNLAIGNWRRVSTGIWVPIRLPPRQVVFNAVKFRNPESGNPVLVLTGWDGIIEISKKIGTT